ncbi:hypothetical protein BCT62_00380 [Vibrio splendidus]|uniref:hypothetical protein n=1 Tax=Vibrio splendidus TaxID=29497 RepID=UPI000C83F64B|nr:hypothetical protein [Vibrio splendidus]PMM19950.1 hypothetical protein BCT62_00380 [Vibrio splendidus]
MKQLDKVLLEGIDNGCVKSLDEFQRRYRPRIKSLYYKAFTDSEGFLRYSRDDLYEDIEMEVWAKFYNSRRKKKWFFDENGSIGGLVHNCAFSIINDKITKALDNRSHLSADNRKKLKAKSNRNQSTNNDLKILSMSYESFEDNDVERDRELSLFEHLGLTEEFTSQLQSRLTQEEQAIYTLLATGSKRENVLVELGLTVDQYRGRRKSIESKAIDLLAESTA